MPVTIHLVLEAFGVIAIAACLSYLAWCCIPRRNRNGLGGGAFFRKLRAKLSRMSFTGRSAAKPGETSGAENGNDDGSEVNAFCAGLFGDGVPRQGRRRHPGERCIDVDSFVVDGNPVQDKENDGLAAAEVDVPKDLETPQASLPAEIEVFDLRGRLAGMSLTENTRVFLDDRLSDLVIDHFIDDDQKSRWGLRVASFLDEVSLLRLHVSPEDRREIEGILCGLREKMNSLELEIIDKDEWDAACQRAVSVARKGDAPGTRILKKIACGLAFRGKIVKKQEVSVEMPLER